MIVPKTALTSDATIATTTLSFSAATASGFETAVPEADTPSSATPPPTAASGSTTISER